MMKYDLSGRCLNRLPYLTRDLRVFIHKSAFSSKTYGFNSQVTFTVPVNLLHLEYVGCK